MVKQIAEAFFKAGLCLIAVFLTVYSFKTAFTFMFTGGH